MTEIQLMSTDDLITELKNRSENIVIVYNTPDKTDNDKQHLHYEYRGEWLMCLGLLDYVREEIIDKNQRDDD